MLAGCSSLLEQPHRVVLQLLFPRQILSLQLSPSHACWLQFSPRATSSGCSPAPLSSPNPLSPAESISCLLAAVLSSSNLIGLFSSSSFLAKSSLSNCSSALFKASKFLVAPASRT